MANLGIETSSSREGSELGTGLECRRGTTLRKYTFDITDEINWFTKLNKSRMIDSGSDQVVFWHRQQRSQVLVGLVYVVRCVDRAKWPYDFDSNGKVRRSRTPSGDPVIDWANGMPYVVVYDGWYAFVGGQALVQYISDAQPSRRSARGSFPLDVPSPTPKLVIYQCHYGYFAFKLGVVSSLQVLEPVSVENFVTKSPITQFVQNL